jgi:hypothetical protein
VNAEPVADDGIVPDGNLPTNVTATAGDGEMVITWDAVDGKTMYGIYWSKSPGISKDHPKEFQIWAGKGSDVAEVSSPFSVTGLDSGATYYFRVAASNGTEITLSEEVSATAN